MSGVGLQELRLRVLSRRSDCIGTSGRVVAIGMNKISYVGYRFPPEIVHRAVWLYLRFTLACATSKTC